MLDGFLFLTMLLVGFNAAAATRMTCLVNFSDGDRFGHLRAVDLIIHIALRNAADVCWFQADGRRKTPASLLSIQ
ncbi:hypothetical protein C2I19_10950 [Chromobacterium alticapitis]|uniref:Secreted protein n=2 Tax=Chromobacterium alticapitis TaxID=2073169 RepID=A0A2S5DFL9_9NEIS|nr:hypothetical protein C2I19_10950 [Chromobacterium alticapitis]